MKTISGKIAELSLISKIVEALILVADKLVHDSERPVVASLLMLFEKSTLAVGTYDSTASLAEDETDRISRSLLVEMFRDQIWLTKGIIVAPYPGLANEMLVLMSTQMIRDRADLSAYEEWLYKKEAPDGEED